MPVRHGTVASGVGLLPTVSLSSITERNETRASFTATVSGNFFSTSVVFQYSTSNTFSSFTQVNAITTPINGQGVSSSTNVTGLSVGTQYYVRCVATNPIGSVTSSTQSFFTYFLRTYANGTAGSYSLTIPSYTPVGGTVLIPTVYNMFILGGGGGAALNGGGGGGYRLLSSRAFTSTANRVLSIVIGGGGTGNGTTGVDGTTGTNGGGTSISASNWTTLSAGGGNTGIAPRTSRGGTVGSGDNPAHGGGYGPFLEVKSIGPPAGGGGGGIGGAGVDGIFDGEAGHRGGAGGAGGSAYGYNGGAGGGGGAQAIGGTSGSAGSFAGFGTGGTGDAGNGSAGLVYFRYYGP
jgi:hypothetical protein